MKEKYYLQIKLRSLEAKANWLEKILGRIEDRILRNNQRLKRVLDKLGEIQ